MVVLTVPAADTRVEAGLICVIPPTGAGRIFVGDFITVDAGIIVIFAGDFIGDDTNLFTIMLCGKQIILL